MLFLQNCGPHIVPSTVAWCSRKRIGTSEGKKTHSSTTLTAQVDTELQECFLQHNTFGTATTGHELNTTTTITATYWYLHEFFAFLEVEVFPTVSPFLTSLHSHERTTLIKPWCHSCVRV